MITEEAYGDVAARCHGCPELTIRRRYDGIKTAEQLWGVLFREGWRRTDYQRRMWGDVYRLWCPSCWRRVKRHPAYDPHTNRLRPITTIRPRFDLTPERTLP